MATFIPLTFSVTRLLFPELAHLSNADFALHHQVTPFWWSLALGACLGGNGTLVGASANVVAVGIAERRDEPIGFWGFTKLGRAVCADEPDRLQCLCVAALFRDLAGIRAYGAIPASLIYPGSSSGASISGGGGGIDGAEDGEAGPATLVPHSGQKRSWTQRRSPQFGQ